MSTTPESHPDIVMSASIKEHNQGIFDTSEFLTQEALLTHAKGQILQATQSTDVLYTDVRPEWGASIADSLVEDGEVERRCGRINYNSVAETLWLRLVHTEIECCHQEWVRREVSEWVQTGLLSDEELRHVRWHAGTTVKFFSGGYLHSRKNPDLIIRTTDQGMPSIVMESGWSEVNSLMATDVRLWLLGTDVSIVMVLKWTKTQAGVAGVIKVYARNQDGLPHIRQRAVIFPAEGDSTESINITRRQLFGKHLLPGTNPDDILPLSLDGLRRRARLALALMGLVPA